MKEKMKNKLNLVGGVALGAAVMIGATCGINAVDKHISQDPSWKDNASLAKGVTKYLVRSFNPLGYKLGRQELEKHMVRNQPASSAPAASTLPSP